MSCAVSSPDPKWAADHGIEDLFPIEIDRSGLNPFRDAGLVLNYVRMLRRSKAQILLGWTAKPNIYGAMAARLVGIPAIPNVSGLGTAFMREGWLASLVGGLYRIAFRRCPIVFFQNPDDRKLFVHRRIIRPDQARLLPGSGVDLDHFRPVPSPNPSAISFLFVGRLLADKGVREFVEAARILKSRHPDWRFQLLGPTDPENRSGIPQEELDRWIVESAVEYLGSSDDVRPFIVASTAVVLPSYREGLPRSLLEAAAMGRPIVATDVPGCRQIIAEDINGLLCDPRSADSLAEAMERLATMTADERETMGREGRKMVERNFGAQKVVDAYADAISQLLDSAGVQPA